MLKEKLSNVLKSIAEDTAKVAANDASAWFMYQEEEPEEVRGLLSMQKKESIKKVLSNAKKIFFSIIMLTMVLGVKIDVEAKDNEPIYVEELGDGLIVEVYKQEDSTPFVLGRGYTYRMDYKLGGTAEANSICKVDLTVSFNYGYDDGIVRINNAYHTVVYLKSGYTVGNFSISRQNGENAVVEATLTLREISSSKYYHDYVKVTMSNNGNVIVQE